MRDVRLLRRKHSVINRHASVDLRSGVYIVFFFIREFIELREGIYRISTDKFLAPARDGRELQRLVSCFCFCLSSSPSLSRLTAFAS